MIINRKPIAPILVNACIAFLLIILNSINAYAQQQRPFKFSNLSVDNGLSHMAVHGVIQDKHGFIWIATLLGLSRYDGRVVKKFYNANMPRRNAFKNRIWSISLDEHNRIWIASEDGIQVFDPETEKYTDIDNLQQKTGAHDFDRIFALKGGLLAVLGGEPAPFIYRAGSNGNCYSAKLSAGRTVYRHGAR